MTSATGVKLHPETLALYKDFKLRKTPFRFVTLHIKDGFIQVDKTFKKQENLTQEEEYKEFVDSLPVDDGRYLWADLQVVGKSGAPKDVMFTISWNPEKATMKSNLVYSMSKKALTDSCHEGMTDVQANDFSDLAYSEIIEKGSK